MLFIKIFLAYLKYFLKIQKHLKTQYFYVEKLSLKLNLGKQQLFEIELSEVELVKLAHFPMPKSIPLTLKFCMKHPLKCIKHTLNLSYEERGPIFSRTLGLYMASLSFYSQFISHYSQISLG